MLPYFREDPSEMSIRYGIALGVLALSLGLAGCNEELSVVGMPGLSGAAPAANVAPHKQPNDYRTDQLLNDGEHGAPGSGLPLRPGHPTT
jgi:hypothetical protein